MYISYSQKKKLRLEKKIERKSTRIAMLYPAQFISYITTLLFENIALDGNKNCEEK